MFGPCRRVGRQLVTLSQNLGQNKMDVDAFPDHATLSGTLLLFQGFFPPSVNMDIPKLATEAGNPGE